MRYGIFIYQFFWFLDNSDIASWDFVYDWADVFIGFQGESGVIFFFFIMTGNVIK